jgi:hypothetical protein
MGFWLFFGVEVIYIIFFVAIVVFSTIAFSSASDAKKASTDPKEQSNYQKAIDMLGWCIGIGYTLIALAIIGIIIAAIAIFFAAPEEAVVAGAAGGADVFGVSTLLREASAFKTVLSKADFSKLEGVLEFASKNSGKILNLTQKTDKLYMDLKGKKDGLLGYNKVFGMSGIFGTLEKIILWSTAFLLFVIAFLAAIAAGYISRTSTKEGYDSAIIATVLGIVPFSIMTIWGISNAVWSHNKTKAINADEAAISSTSTGVVYRPMAPPAKRQQAPPAKQQSPKKEKKKEIKKQPKKKTTKKQSSPKKASPKQQPQRKAPPPPAPVPVQQKKQKQQDEASQTDVPYYYSDIHPSDSYDIATQGTMSDIMSNVNQRNAKSTAQQGADIAQSVVKHADTAHQILSSLKGSVDPNSSHGQLLSNATDVLGKIKGQKDTVDRLSQAVNAM